MIEVDAGPITLFVEFTHHPGDTYPVTVNTITPPEGPSVELKHVWVGHSNGRIDILNSLSSAERINIEDICIESS